MERGGGGGGGGGQCLYNQFMRLCQNLFHFPLIPSPWAIMMDFQMNHQMDDNYLYLLNYLTTVPTNNEVFLSGLWLCGKSRS